MIIVGLKFGVLLVLYWENKYSFGNMKLFIGVIALLVVSACAHSEGKGTFRTYGCVKNNNFI